MPQVRALLFEQINFSMLLNSLRPLTVIAGENGSGKSRALRCLTLEAVEQRKKVIAVASSAYHRFSGMGRRCKVLAPKRAGSAPEKVLKKAIRNAQSNDEIQLRSISRVLRHCNYSPAIGFKVEPLKMPILRHLRDRIESAARIKGQNPEELEAAIFMLSSVDALEPEWINFDGISFDISREKNFSRLLFWEEELVDLGAIKPIKIFLKDFEKQIALREASSGELSLITSMAFIATTISGIDLLLIDEPENSLHPQWQRDYIDILAGVIGYSGVKIVVATHSPILVVGLESSDIESEIFVLSKMMHAIENVDGSGLEEVMAKVFMTITPKNHFLSEKLVSILDRLEDGRIKLAGAVRELQDLKATGLDQQQRTAVELVDKMARSIAGDKV